LVKPDLKKDILAGFVNAVTNVPDAMANALLVGVSPLQGLYSLIIGTPVASLTTGSSFLTVAVTAAMALAAGDALSSVPTEGRVEALIALTVMVGMFQVLLALIRGDRFLRFVSNSVIRGFLTGVAVAIVFNQVPSLLGSTSEYSNKVLRALDIALRPYAIDYRTATLGLLALALILVLERTRVGGLATPVALVAVTVAASLTGWEVKTVGDIASITRGLPQLQVPGVAVIASMFLPAIAVALIGLIQGAGVSKSTPEPDGTYPSVKRDFLGQGLGNIAAGVITGVPVGGSVSSTALNVQLGATSRWANFVIGPVVAIVLFALGPLVERVPMTALAAVLVLVGVRAIDIPRILAVWHTSVPSAFVMAATFGATLIMPIQFAVLLGASLSVLQYVFTSSMDVKVVRLQQDEEGRLVESPAPEQLASHAVTVLDIYGSIFYAGADVIERSLPDPVGSEQPAVIIRLRGRTDLGSTFLGVVRRYRVAVRAVDGRLMLSGVGAELLDQLRRTEMVDILGEDNIFEATPVVTGATEEAIAAAELWLKQPPE
jgi:sulfate permease, SulP family